MAPAWGWVLAYVLGFLLFQAAIYWYLQGQGTTIEGPARGHPEGDVVTHPAIDSPDADADPDSAIRCPHCGASNDREPGYRYCRECVRELP
ncbi:MAG: hypothetical protein ABEI98_03685 [Halorhabdus sp.]